MALRLAHNWWVLAVRGALAILFGLLALAWPFDAIQVVVLFYGAFALVGGLSALAAVFMGHEMGARWWALLVEGIIGVILGIVIFVAPSVFVEVLVFLVGFWSIVTGVFEIAAAWQLRKSVAGEFWLGLAGLVSVIFGVLVLLRPVAGILAVVWLIGFYAIFFGCTQVGLALRLRQWHANLKQPS